MGLCMETTGMTQGGVDGLDCGLYTEAGSVDETESMDDGQDTEFGPMTVEIKSLKKTDTSANDAAPRAPDLKDIFNIDPLQQGQALVAASKKRKKQQKRADKIATKLSDTLTAAMDF